MFINAGGPGSGRKPSMNKSLKPVKPFSEESPKTKARIRSNPRQTSLFGPGHTKELQKYYKMKAVIGPPMPKFNIGSPFKKSEMGMPKAGPNERGAKLKKPIGHTPNAKMPGGQGMKHRLPNPTALNADGDYGEPMAGAMQHAHLDSRLFFHPPSLRNPDRIPTDDPKETNDRFLDVTKRNSKDTQEQRMKLLKRSTPGGNPPMVPVHTTLVSPFQNSYSPMNASARMRRRHGGGMFRKYGAAKI